MKPLSRLFRAPPPPSRESGSEPLDAASPEQIAAAAAGDGEEERRIAAVRLLQDGEVLRNLAGFGDRASPISPSIERTALERIARLIDAGVVDIDGLCSSTANIAAVLAVAGLAADPDCLPRALAAIEDRRLIAKLVVEGPSSRLRQLAAQRIEDPAELKELLGQVRGKDKNVYKIIKQKCDALQAEEQRIAQTESDIQALCASLERHSKRIYDALYEPALRLYDAQWRTLEAQAGPQIRERVRLAVNSCREVAAGHQRQMAQRAAEESHRAALRAAREEAAVRTAGEALRRQESAAVAAAAAAALRAAEEQARAEKSAAEAHALRQIGGLIAKANGALRDGNTGQAAGLRRAIETKLPTVPAIPAHFATQVQQLDAKLNELKEWKDYAVAPKRAALIEHMEALIGSPESPKVLAERIKRLQQEWKTISKGIISDSEADWQRFHRASESAYLPCREHFEAQANARRKNVEKRMTVLDRLRTFESAQSGEHTDWRAVAAVLREAPLEWRKLSPVERAPGRALQQEFDSAIARLQARLDQRHALNAQEKRALIERAQQLLTKDDGREAVEAVKRLQLQWKEVGAVRRDQEQPLWNQFREQCDAVFQKRQQAYAEYARALETNKGQAVALCEEAEQAAALSGPALLEGVAKIPHWRAAFEAIGDIPRTDQRGVQERFERAIRRCQAQVAQQRVIDKEQSFTNLLEAARRIQAYGWAVARNDEAAERDALKHAAESFIAGVRQWPKGGAQALQQAWVKADAGPDTIDEDTELRTLCIRSEIFAEMPTPPEDQDLRRDYQVQRLLRTMGQHHEANPEELDALLLEWVRTGPASPATYESLLARFLRCRRGSR